MRTATIRFSLAMVGLGLLVLGSWSCSARKAVESAGAERFGEASPGVLRFEPKSPQRWVMSNGLVVLFMPDDGIPMVEGTLVFPGGKAAEKPGHAGVAAAFGEEVRDGSFEGLAPEALDAQLDGLAAAIESKSGTEFGTVSFSCLTEDMRQVLPLFAGVVERPAFDEKRLALWKSFAADSARRRRDDPEAMAEMTLMQVLYGADSPYAQEATTAGIARIGREALREFGRQFLRPNGSLLAITGNLKSSELREMLDEYLGGWTEVKTELPALPEARREFQPGIYVIERDFKQSAIHLGHFGPARQSDDEYALAVLGRYFSSGSFGSVLFSEIRSKRGLAYAIDGGFYPGLKTGVFDIALGTRGAETSTALREVLAQLRAVRVDVPRAERIEQTKSAVNHAFVFKFATPAAVVTRAAHLELMKYPEDFDRTYLERIRSVGPAEVRQTAERRIDPERLAIVVVGKYRAEDLAREFAGKFNVYRLGFDEVPRFDQLRAVSAN